MAGRMRIITTLILAASFLAWQPDASASPQSLDKLKKERQASKKQLRQTRQQINANTRETERNLRALEGLRVDIARQQRIISAANISADSVGRAMTAVEDSIAMAEASLKRLKASYASSLRKMQGQMSPRSRWIFLLSASDIREIYRRARYLKQVKEAQEAKARRVKEARLLLTERRNRLASLNTERRNHLERAALAGRQLEEKRAETDRVIASLRQKKGELQQTLQELEARRRRLDSQIDALIAQQIRNQEEARKKKEAKKKQSTDASRKKTDSSGKKKAEKPSSPPLQQTADPDRELSGSFASNRGRLLFPVSVSYTIVRSFGLQKHPELPNVTTDNSGIDISVKPGTPVRAVFTGKVSAIFRQPGFGTIVMLRHGSYISIYAGLASINVRNGQEVSTGQTLGSVAQDDADPGRGLLHFELRNERTKLNPLQWVR